MKTQSEFDRLARDWLADGPTELADRVLDAALAEIHVTRQRRRPGAAWRFAQLSNQAKLALAIAAVIVVAVAGSLVLRRGDQGHVGASPTPAPSPGGSQAAAAASVGPATGPRVTMNDKGCYGEHLDGLRAGAVAIETVSTTQDEVQWDLLSNPAPHTWSEVAVEVIARQQRVAAGGIAGSAMAWMQGAAQADTRPTARTSTLQGSLLAGEYLVVCVGVAADLSNTGVFIVGPIEVKP